MIIIKSRCSFGPLFSLVQWSFLLLAIAAMVLYFLSSLQHSPQEQMIKEVPRRVFPLEGFLSGPLGLRENTRSALALSIEQKLVLLAQSVRPDWGSADKAYRIGINGTEQQRVAREGEVIDCQLSLHPSGGAEVLRFSDSEADLKLIPQVLDHRSLKLLVEPVGQEAFEILLRADRGHRDERGLPPLMRQLKEASWVGKDCFFSQYGGETFSQMGSKEKMKVGTQWLYVCPGDFLSVEEGQWRVLSSIDEAKADAPLATVLSTNGGHLKIEAWDDKGFSLFEANLQKQLPSAIHSKPSLLITDAKRRTAQGISCKIEGKRWILRQGDWLLSTESGWRMLQKDDEISAYLHQELLGELIVIDGLEPNGFLKGHVVSELRTKVEPFSMQVASAPPKRTRSRR